MEIQKQSLLDYLTAFRLASQLTQKEKLQFVAIAHVFRRHPFRGEIHVAAIGEGEPRVKNQRGLRAILLDELILRHGAPRWGKKTETS